MVDTVQAMIEQRHYSVTGSTFEGRTVVHVAGSRHHVLLVCFMSSLIHLIFLASFGHIPLLNYLKTVPHIHLNAKDMGGFRPVDDALRYDKIRTVQWFLDEGVLPEGTTVLF